MKEPRQLHLVVVRQAPLCLPDLVLFLLLSRLIHLESFSRFYQLLLHAFIFVLDFLPYLIQLLLTANKCFLLFLQLALEVADLVEVLKFGSAYLLRLLPGFLRGIPRPLGLRLRVSQFPLQFLSYIVVSVLSSCLL